MFDFGDELTIHSYRIPWLIWIQILVLFLLLLLFFCFSLSTSDLCYITPSASSSSSSSSSKAPPRSARFLGESYEPLLSQSRKTTIVNSCQHNQVGADRSVKLEIPTTGRRVVMEDKSNREAESTKDANPMDLHPCNYFRLAKLAFLKCLGLECLYENSSCSEQKKER